jgi:hypothetical protein
VKIGKPNELGFPEMVAILSPLGLYGGNQKSKMPLVANWEYMPFEVFTVDFVHLAMSLLSTFAHI